MDCSKLLFEEKPLSNKPWYQMAINSSPRDTQPNELIIRSSFMLIAFINAFIATPIVSMVYTFRGDDYDGIFPLSYSIIMVPLLIFYTNNEGHYDKIVMIHQILTLVLPICLQYKLGGLIKSGAIFLASLLCPLGAAFFTTKKAALRWFVLYVIIFFGLFFLEYNYYTTDSSTSSSSSGIGSNNGHGNELILSPRECVFFFMNIGGVLFITFSVGLMIRTKLASEYKKSERLIDNVLPKSIAKRLKEGESQIINNFEGVTILFADLVGFTSAAAVNQPSFLIGLFLRDVFSAWDQLLLLRDIDKIKTIGDAFMAVGGIEENQERASRKEVSGNSPDENNKSNSSSQRSAKEVTLEMILLALEMQQALNVINKRYNVKFNCRIGIHTGPVIAGVIGMKKFSFDVWGDAVNTASRMESHGIPGYLQFSSHTYKEVKSALSSLGIPVLYRGKIGVKGKGKMKTYLIQMSEDENAAVADTGAAAIDGPRRQPISKANVPPTGDVSSAEK